MNTSKTQSGTKTAAAQETLQQLQEKFTAVAQQAIDRPVPNLNSPLSPEEKAELDRMVKKIIDNDVEAAEMLQLLHDEKWRYRPRTWQQFLAEEFGRSDTWAREQLNWLRRKQLVEKAELRFGFSVADSRALRPLEDHPEEFLRALLDAEQQAKEQGKRRSTKMLRAAVQRQDEYLTQKKFYARQYIRDVTYEEWAALRSLGDGNEQGIPPVLSTAIELAASSQRPFEDCLTEVCRREKRMPSDRSLLAHGRGDDLIRLCARLKPVKDDLDKQALKEEEKKLEEGMAKMQEEQHQAEKMVEEKQAALGTAVVAPSPAAEAGGAKPEEGAEAKKDTWTLTFKGWGSFPAQVELPQDFVARLKSGQYKLVLSAHLEDGAGTKFVDLDELDTREYSLDVE